MRQTLGARTKKQHKKVTELLKGLRQHTKSLEAFGPLPKGDPAIANLNKKDASRLNVFPAYGVHLEGLKELMASTGALTQASDS